MRCECPTFRRCCLCLPLRFGLMGAGCTKLIVDLFFLTLLLIHFPHLYKTAPSMLELSPYFIIILLFVTDLIFNIVLLYGCCKKDSVKLRMFNRYSIFLLGINIFCLLFAVGMDILVMSYKGFIYMSLYMTIISFTSWMTIILLNLYLMALVRSEVVKLENNAQFQFTNTADGACVMATDDGVQQTVPAVQSVKASNGV